MPRSIYGGPASNQYSKGRDCVESGAMYEIGGVVLGCTCGGECRFWLSCSGKAHRGLCVCADVSSGLQCVRSPILSSTEIN